MVHCGLGLVWLCLITASPAAPQPSSGRLPDYDSRLGTRKSPPISTEQKNARANLQTRLPGVRVDFNELTGSPRMVSAGDGFLSGPQGRGKTVSAEAAAAFAATDPDLPTKAFLTEHRKLFGHGPEALAPARVVREYVTPHNGLRTVVWQQQVDGIPVFESVLISHTTRKGELVNLSSGFLSDPVAAADRGVPLRATVIAAPTVNAPSAVRAAAQNVGETVTPGETKTLEAAAAGAEQRQKFQAKALPGNTSTSLIWLPVNRQELRLCWDVTLTSRSQPGMYRLLVDAQTGKVWLRRCLTRNLSDASYRVFTSDSPSPFSPGQSTPSATQPALVSRTLVTLSALDTNASPNGWIDDGVNETQGNNVDAHTDHDFNDVADLPRPQGAPSRVFDFPMDLTSQDPTNYSAAAVVQLFFLCNWMHDRLYELGFTEAAGNFQVNNFGRGGQENDALQADAQDGEDVDNANMSTPLDGTSPRMQMFIFSQPSPRRDGDLDAEVVLHEYTHGLSWRLVGGGQGLGNSQSDGLGEGWSDFYALALLSEPGDDVNGCYASGAYVSHKIGGTSDQQNYYFGIRRYPYTTDLNKNPLTFKDIDPAQADYCASGAPYHTEMFGACSAAAAAEVHNAGEVWCVTLWEARANLINKYGWAAGNELILQLVTDGMKLSPMNPNFLEARDAILQADEVDNGGSNLDELWAAFAKRGMGFSATSPDSTTSDGVVESFDLPDDLSVAPSVGFVSSGLPGGPFNLTSQNYILTNIGAASLNWSIVNTSFWLNVSAGSGTLTPGGVSTNVTVSLNPSADALPQGLHSSTVVFTNHASTRTQSRLFTLRVGMPDHYTQLFDSSTNDTAYQTWTFTPDGSTSLYSVCRETAANFPTDPAGGTTLSLTDDSFAPVTLTGVNTVALYQRRTNVLYVSSNGYLTLNAGTNWMVESLASHFGLPRISALFHDLNPADAGTISWKETGELVAVTFSNVPEYDDFHLAERTNSFQIELFYDGRIRLTLLNVGIPDGLIGLSAGQGMPANFLKSDFTGYGQCLPPLELQLPTQTTEGAGVLAGQGHAILPVPLATNLPVALASLNPNNLTVASSVIITAGQTNASFDLTVVDDGVLDGSQLVTVTASASGFTPGQALITVHDNESAVLQVTLPASTNEGAGLVPGTVSASAPPAALVTVQLSSSDPTAAQVPAAVIIPSGQTSAVFNVTIVDDALVDGPQSATITAHVRGWTDGTALLTVLDPHRSTFQNPGLITIPDGPASPYPSTIIVSNLAGAVTKVTATLSNLSHTYPDDLDILLVGPTGTNVMLMSDAGGLTDLVGVNLTFDDQATNLLSDSGVITSGTYQPTNFATGDVLPSPAPLSPFGPNLAGFKGQNPNGTWQLFVYDDFGSDTGSLNNGWSLQINVISPAAPVFLPPDLVSNQMVLHFNSTTGLTYNVQYKTNLADPTWQLLQSLSGDGTTKTVTNLIDTNRSRFYRLEIP
jgi:subtilisin-like proprotein convertase family protein